MKRKTKKRPIPALRTDATDEDIVRWTRAHAPSLVSLASSAMPAA